MELFGYPDLGFSVLFPQLEGKCQAKTRKDGARPALLQNFWVLCILCFVSFCVLFLCKCVLYYWHRVATQFLLTNVIISYMKCGCYLYSFCRKMSGSRCSGRADCNRPFLATQRSIRLTSKFKSTDYLLRRSVSIILSVPSEYRSSSSDT